MTLKDAKILNLNDELKGGIVKVLTKFLKRTIDEKLSMDTINDANIEKELITSLNSFKNNCHEECSQFLLASLTNKIPNVSNVQLIYAFRILKILFECLEKVNKKNSEKKLVKNYKTFCDNFLLHEITDIDLLCTIYEAHIALLKSNKEQLEFTIIDDLFCFFIDSRNRPPTENTEDFCRFYELVGQFLFVIGNSHQKYFRSRTPQFFNSYNQFLNSIYYYRMDSEDDFTPKEISLLLKLTLQLEK